MEVLTTCSSYTDTGVHAEGVDEASATGGRPKPHIEHRDRDDEDEEEEEDAEECCVATRESGEGMAEHAAANLW